MKQSGCIFKKNVQEYLSSGLQSETERQANCIATGDRRTNKQVATKEILSSHFKSGQGAISCEGHSESFLQGKLSLFSVN